MRISGAALLSGIFVLFLSACGGAGGGSASGPLPSGGGPTPTPTPTPAPSPTNASTLPPSGSLLVAYNATPPPIAYDTYTAPGGGYSIATAGDGSIYVSQGSNADIVRDSNGTITVSILPASYGGLGNIALGSDGAMWFSSAQQDPVTHIISAQAIGRIDASGNISEYNVPWTMSSPPFGVALGPDGNIWFTEFYEGRVGRITPQGAFSDFSLGSNTHRPSGIATGPDGNLWVAESAGTTIERVSPTGTVLNTYTLSTMLAYHIVAGPDGAMWFVDAHNGLGRIDMQGNIREWQLPCNVPNVGNYCLPGYFQGSTDITAGPDGALWFVASNFRAIGRITTSGILTEWAAPAASNGPVTPVAITSHGSSVLFTGSTNFIGKVSL